MATRVPQSDEEVFAEYYPHIKYLVGRKGIRKDYVDDYAMTLVSKFVEKGVLSDYDPERLTEVKGEQRTASFKTFLSGFVNSYLRHFAERDAIHAYRSALSSDMRVGENADIPLLDYLGKSTEDDHSGVEVREWVDSVRTRLGKEPRGRKLVLFLDMVMIQVAENGKVDTGELAEMFEVTRSTIHNWLKKLRETFNECR